MDRGKRRELEKKADDRKKRAYSCFGPFGYVRSDGRIHYSSRSNAQRMLKKQSNRKVRRSKKILKGAQYRREFDYWWMLY